LAKKLLEIDTGRALAHDNSTSPMQNPLEVPEDQIDTFQTIKDVNRTVQTGLESVQQVVESATDKLKIPTISIGIGMVISSIVSILIIYGCKRFCNKNQENAVEAQKPKIE
jgi:hypothetical protein